LIEKYLPPAPEAEQESAGSEGPQFDTPDGMRKILTESGFTAIQVISETADFTYATKDEWWESRWSHGARGPLERIESTGGSEMLERFKKECLERLSQKSQNIPESFHVLYTLAKRP
jgi:hypothetical protein